MGNPLSLCVVALDPVLEAGAVSALSGNPDIALVQPEEKADVAVVIFDRVARRELDLVNATGTGPHRPAVIVIASDLSPAEAADAINAGARGLLRRHEVNADRLARTVLTVAGGDCTVPPDLIDGLLDQGTGTDTYPGARGRGPDWGLDERERAVLRMVADGRETDEIAKELCYSARTVTTVVRDITQRFRLRNRAHAVAYALRTGLL
ncbi:response regulator transcription factor [Streptomyces minutiscleroticus]|uniref:Helix-turn-helix transcriptional regulator n=1 Tax=Streptomyces minutiscleroticus TaxID=68238 RepID=A0A918NSN3_9ACTN|nr:response regulator transcription factor [Streptomyces minutiscleroticus]GGX92245.1 helix-turn-helix transcriptional regulator [Streptomyces minutiscleroticus]